MKAIDNKERVKKSLELFRLIFWQELIGRKSI